MSGTPSLCNLATPEYVAHLHKYSPLTNMSLFRQLRPVARSRAFAARARWHCQVPCGIFDDPARVDGLAEDAATIRKAMVQINELSAESTPLAINQVWRLSTCTPHPVRCVLVYCPACDGSLLVYQLTVRIVVAGNSMDHDQGRPREQDHHHRR
jgi:hypothetical protein